MLDRIKKLRSHILRWSVGMRLVISQITIIIFDLPKIFSGFQMPSVTDILSSINQSIKNVLENKNELTPVPTNIIQS